MSPDLLYFLMLQTQYRGFSHSWLGLLLFCLPAGMLFAYCFHRFFKYQAIYNLPRPFDIRLSGLAEQSFQIGSFGGWMKLALSVLLGTLTHFFWDSFTHPWGEMAQMFEVFSEVFTLWGIQRPLCRWLQHVSTIAGAVVMLRYVLKGCLLPPPAAMRPTRSSGSKLLFWLVGGVVATLFACLVVYCFDIVYDLQLRQGHNTISAMSSFGLAGWAGFFYYVCIYGILSKRRAGGMGETMSDES